MAIHVDGQKMRDLATKLQKEIPGWGFALIVFKFGDSMAMSNYISNAQREDMIAALEIQLESLKGKRDFPTPEAN